MPAPLRWLANRGPYALPGGPAIVNANSWTASAGYEVDRGPAMRMVVDLSDLDGRPLSEAAQIATDRLRDAIVRLEGEAA